MQRVVASRRLIRGSYRELGREAGRNPIPRNRKRPLQAFGDGWEDLFGRDEPWLGLFRSWMVSWSMEQTGTVFAGRRQGRGQSLRRLIYAGRA